MLTEWSWTTIMTVKRDSRTRRRVSVLCSSNVQFKLLLCVNKEDRKWQFGSSNQECHSQLRPLPAPDTSHGQRGHGPDSFFHCFRLFSSLVQSRLPCALRDFQFQCHLRNTEQWGRRQNDVRKTRAGVTAAHFLKALIKHEACLVRLPRHCVSKSALCLSEAEKQMSWVCLPSLDRAVKIFSWRTPKTAQMERTSCLRLSLFLCQDLSFPDEIVLDPVIQKWCILTVTQLKLFIWCDKKSNKSSSSKHVFCKASVE